nr:O-antigen ligase family protein [Marinobacter sp. C7]
MVVLGSSSRGGQLALIFQILFKNLKFVLRLKVIASVLLVGASIWYLLPPEQKMRFENIGQDVSSKQRILYWENGFKMMQSHPWLGVGYYNYIPYYEKYYPEDMLYSRAELPHNIFIQVGADLGYPALVLYLSMIIYVYLKTKALKKSLRSQGKDPLFVNILDGLNISLVGFVVAGQFVSVVYYPFLWIHFAIFVSCENIIIKEMVAGEERARKAVRFAGAHGVEACDRLQRPEP